MSNSKSFSLSSSSSSSSSSCGRTFLVSILCWYQLTHTIADLITVQYYNEDNSCGDHTFGVSVNSNTCIQHQSTSVIVNCTSSGGLVITEFFNSSVCSGTHSDTILTNAIDTCSTSTNFATNSYFASPLQSFRVTCSNTEEWVNEANYILSRTTTVLQASSAIDFTEEVCSENSLATDMQYCFLNSATTYCLSTDTDSDSTSSSSICLPAPVMYAYSSGCMTISPTTNDYYKYSTNNRGLGVLQDFSDSGCTSSTENFQLPYSECLGCNRFKDLKNSNNPNGSLAAGIVALIVILVILFCCCAVGGCLSCCFPAVAAGFLAFFCCRRKTPEPVTVTAAVPASNVTYPMTQSPYAPQPAYVQPTYGNQPAPAPAPGGYNPSYTASAPPPPPPGYGYPQPSAPLETITVQVPIDAKPGQIILVPKSNGQQIQVQLPENVIPGGVIQVQG